MFCCTGFPACGQAFGKNLDPIKYEANKNLAMIHSKNTNMDSKVNTQMLVL